MTPVLRAFAANQPITHIVEAVRALMLGAPMGDHGWLAVVWSIGLLAVAVPLATWLFKNKDAR